MAGVHSEQNERLKHEEIATQLNISVHTVQNHIVTAIRKLKVELKDYLLSLFSLSKIFSKIYFFLFPTSRWSEIFRHTNRKSNKVS